MSRLDSRIAELERHIGGCPDCRPTIALVQKGGATPEHASCCRDCGQPVEQITVVASFDPGI